MKRPHKKKRESRPLSSAVLETCLYVDDLSRARNFYSGLFGYLVMQSDDRFCALNVGDSQVLILFVRGSIRQGAVLPLGTIPPHDGIGPAHVGFSIPADSLPAWERRLRARGIPVESVVKWPKGGTSIYFRDPDGHLLELVTPGIWPNY